MINKEDERERREHIESVLSRSCPYRTGRARESAMLECKKGVWTKHTLFTSHDDREFHVRAYCSDINHEVCPYFKTLEEKK